MKIVAIAPYYGLKEVIQSVVNQLKEVDVEVKIGNLEEGVKLAKEAEANGADILISRGGTAALIQREVKIPVIDIEVSTYDLLSIFTLIKDNEEKKAIVGFESVIESALRISNLLEIEVSTYIIEQEADVMPKLVDLQKNDYQIIIGDTITVRNAESIGLNGLLLTSGKESVTKAFEEAIKIKNIYGQITNKELIPKVLLDQYNQAIIVLDKELNVSYKNEFAKSLCDDENIKDLTKWGKEIFIEGSMSTLVESKKKMWIVNGCVMAFHNEKYACLRIAIKENKEGYKKTGLKVIAPLHDEPLQSMNWFSAKNSSMKDTILKAKAFSLQDENVWIYGEVGTGKEKFASLMHLGSERALKPLIVVDCELMTTDGWAELFGNNQNDDGIIKSNVKGTLYLKKIEKLSLDNQKALLNYLRQNDLYPKIITSSSKKELEQKIDEGIFLYDLFLILSPLKLMIPPLRERKEDLEGLVKLFINKFNYDYGKELAGIRSEAIEALHSYTWPGNLNELKQVMKEVILTAEGPFINKKEIENTLVKYQPLSPYLDSAVPLSGTLKDIELSIIKRVFEEEHKNHSKTAKRLGINRSTLWRRLKGE